MTAEEFTTALERLVATAIEAGLSDTEVGSMLEQALDALYGLTGSS